MVIYGPGGIGKTTLAHLVSKHCNPLIIDLERGSLDLDCERIDEIDSFETLRAVIQDKDLWENRGALILDSATMAEELITNFVIRTVPHPEKPGTLIKSIEDYGWGKGFGHIYDAFLLLLSDLDVHFLAKRHVILIAHDCVSEVPNPNGPDWIRYEPRLQNPKSGKNSVRLRVKEWCDHLLFLGWDVATDDSGKAMGGGTRTIYPFELPSHFAKSRTVKRSLPFENETDDSLWTLMIGKEGG